MKSILLAAFGDLRRTWQQLVLVNLLSGAIGIIVTAPLVAGLLGLFLAFAGDQVLSDVEIAEFVASPLGFVAIATAATVWLGLLLVTFSLATIVGFGATEGRRVTYLDALRFAIARSRSLLRLALRILGLTACCVAPLLVAAGAAYLVLLREHDINYYIAVRPPEFVRALWIVGAVGGVCGLVLLRALAVRSMALPIVLFEGVGAPEALRRSRSMRSAARSIFGLLLGWAALVLGLSTAGSWVVARVGGLLLAASDFTFKVDVVVLAFTLVLAALVDMVIDFVAHALLPLGLVRLYRSLSTAAVVPPELERAAAMDESSGWRVPRPWIVPGAIVGAGGVLLAGWFVSQGVDAGDRVEVIAHRGASAEAPENTMAAFELAIEEGADWIELDVQEDSDGQVVVAHDRDFMKQARVSLAVADSTAAKRADMDIGSWFDPRFAGERVVTLAEVLEHARDRVRVVIELKYYGRQVRLEERVAEIVERAGMVDQVEIMSLSRDGLRRFRAIRPGWPSGLLSTASLGDLTQLGHDFLALNSVAASRKTVHRAHQRGTRVYAWTINDPVQMWALISRGVDGLITDRPGLARDVLELRESTGPIARFVVWMSAETGLLDPRAELPGAGDA
ncbi:MAG: glycerophosphodiester phosphodiesterase family protein [Planctomycetota bacterium]